MTTPSTERKAGPLLGTGAQTAWPFTFKVFAATDIAVTIANSLGVETALVYGVDYNVILNANQETSPGGTVTYPISGTPLPTGSKLTIFGNLPYDQPLDLPSGGNFSPLALENELDRLTMQIQQLREQVGRSLTMPVTSGVSPSLPSPAASNLIGWNENGDNLENYPLSELATSLAFATYRYDTFTGNGSTTQFTLSADPVTLGNLDVAISGVTQVPGTDYTLVAGVLQFTSAPANGTVILARFGEGIASGPSMDSYDVRFQPAGTGAVQRTAEDKLRDQVCVFDFMTPAQIAAVKAQISTEDLSIPFQQAINTSKRVYIPKGRYRVNVQIDSKTILEGDGSQSTILQPYNDAVAIMTYTFTAQQTPAYAFWDYHSEVHGIGFWGKTTQTGIGFTFGTTVPANYTTNMEYANNVKFFGCRFYNLEKGIQFPFGNIGTEFYSCGFSSNYYGAYLLDCKFPAGSPNTMHAGNKYWYAGEFSGNEVGIYVNDVTDGFGAVELRDTIMEYNRCAAYLYIGARTFVPVKFENVWFEGNGSVSSGPATVTVDTWTGAVKGTTTLNKKTVFIDGQNANVIFENTATTDVRVMGTGCSVYVNGGWTARLPGYMGGEFVVDNPGKSFIRVDSPNSTGGFPVGPSVYTIGAPMVEDLLIGASPTSAQLRHYWTTPRTSKVRNYGPSLVNALTLTGATQLSGTATVNSTLVADGQIFSVCCEFTRAAFLTNEYLEINTPTSNVNIGTAGYYVATLDVKRTQGNPKIFVWDRNTKQFAIAAEIPSLNRWYTMAAIGYSDGSAGTIFVDFQGDGGNCTWRVSAFQAMRFDTYAEANMYLESGAYAMKNTALSVASAATITAPQDNDIVLVTGTTNIDSVTATGQVGRTITLVFDGVLTVNDGTGNLALTGNFTTSANDALMLTCDGTTWYEVSRSAN